MSLAAEVNRNRRIAWKSVFPFSWVLSHSSPSGTSSGRAVSLEFVQLREGFGYVFLVKSPIPELEPEAIVKSVCVDPGFGNCLR